MNSQIILLVDDEPHILAIMSHILKRKNYNIETACNGEEGLQKAIKLRPSIIITDVQMPRMKGPEMCRQLLEKHPEFCPLIVVASSRTEHEIRDWVSQHSHIVFKEKPISPVNLLTLVAQHFSSTTLVRA